MNRFQNIKEFSVFQFGYFLCGLVCLLLVIILLSPMGEELADYFNNQALVQSNHSYLQDLAKKDRSELLLLSEINGFLSFIQSSELGVSFVLNAQIQVGNILNPLTEITQQSFNSTLSSLHLTNGLLKVLTLLVWLTPIVAICLLILISLYCFSKLKKIHSEPNNHLKAIIINLATLLFTLHLLIPYSLYMSAQIDKALYHSFSEDVRNDLKNLHQTLVSDKNKNGLIEKTEYFIKNLERMLLDIPKKTEALISYHSNQTILTVLRIIIMPGIILLILFLFTRFYIKRLILVNSTYKMQYQSQHQEKVL